MKWFRFYNEVIDDIKMMQLSDYEYRMFTYLLAYASQIDSTSGELQTTFTSLSLRFHQRFNLFSRAIETLQKSNMVSVDKNGNAVITNWSKRQFKSDNVSYRVKKYRSFKQKSNVSVTPPDTDTDTDTEKDKKKASPRTADFDFISQLKGIYTWIDVDTEIEKMKGWLLTPKGKGRKLTQRFAVNWLNKIDKPIEEEKSKDKQPKQKYKCEICGGVHELGRGCAYGEQVKTEGGPL